MPENSQLRPALAHLPRVPDLLTTANLCCGVLSVLFAVQGELTISCWFIFIAALFDVFDGLAARTQGGGSEFGKQLDSLADMVSFGVAPGFLVHQMIGKGLTTWIYLRFLTPDVIPSHTTSLLHWSLWPAYVIGLAIPVAAAWRLAKFNIDTRQSHGFLGLPTPANALFWAGLIMWMVEQRSGEHEPARWLAELLFDPVVMAPVVILLAALMLVEIPLPSLKFTQTGWRGNEVMYVLAGLGAVLVIAFGFLAVPLLLFLYLTSPLWGQLFPKPQ